MLKVQGKSLLVSHRRGDEMMLARVVFFILGPLCNFLNHEVLQRGPKSIESGVSLTCHLNPLMAFVGRVATRRNNIS